MRNTYESPFIHDGELKTFENCTISPDDNIDIYSVTKNKKFDLDTDTVIDLFINHDNIKSKLFKVTQLKRSITIEKNTTINNIQWCGRDQRYSIYLLDTQKEYIVFKTYSWNWDKLEHYFIKKDNKEKYNTAFDFKYLNITCHSLPIVFQPHVVIKDETHFTYNVRLTGVGFEKSRLQRWFDAVTKNKVKVLSVSSKSDDSGFHSYSRCDLQQYKIELELKTIVKKEITEKDIMKLMGEEIEFFKKGNVLIFVEYKFDEYRQNPSTTVLKLNSNKMIVDVLSSGGGGFLRNSKDFRTTEDLKGLYIK